MMKSEHAGQRNLQQSGAAGQRNTQHAKEMRKRSMRRKKARRMRRIKRIFVAAIIAAGRTSFVQRLLKSLECKIRGNTYGRGYPESLVQLYEKNEEARQFVLDYKKNGNNEQPIDISSDVTDGKIPLFFFRWKNNSE